MFMSTLHPPPVPVQGHEATTQAIGYRALSRDEAKEKVLAFAASRGCRFSASEVASSLGCSHNTASGLLAELRGDGLVLRLPDRGAAWMLPGSESPPTNAPVTISVLRGLAIAKTNPNLVLENRGRLTADQRMARHELSTGQLKDVLSALSTLKRLCGCDEEAQVPANLLLYDVASAKWTGVEEIERRYVQYRKAAGQRRGGGAITGDRALRASRAKLSSSLSLLFDLAAHHEVINRNVRPPELEVAWLEWLPSTDRGRRLRVNARCLARVASELGMRGPDEADWARVGVRLRELMHQPGRESTTRNAIDAFRKLGLTGLPPAHGGRVARTAALPAMAVAQAVGGNWDLWLAQGLASLVDGPGGLRHWCESLTVAAAVKRRMLGLPGAHSSVLHAGASRNTRNREGIKVNRPVTVKKKLTYINRVLGQLSQALSREEWVTLTTYDLVSTRHLSVLENFESQATRSGVEGTLAGLAQFCGTIRAQQGDNGAAVELNGMAAALRQDANSIDKNERARARATSQVWGGQANAMRTAIRFRELLIREVEDCAQRPIDEQLKKLRAGTVDWVRGKWSLAVRNAVMVGLLLRIPLRSETLRGVRLTIAPDPETREVSSLWSVAKHAKPWEGEIQLICPPGAMKSGRWFQPYLINACEVNESASESSLRRDLLELYLHPGGARASLTSQQAIDEGWFFVGQGGRQIDRPSIIVREQIGVHAAELGLDFKALIAAKCGGVHSFRHLFGSTIAPIDLMVASRMLDHRNTMITENIYCSFDERDCNIDAVMRRLTLIRAQENGHHA